MVNKVILIGNVGKDPEVRMTQDGKDIANLSVATSESWKDKATGEKKENTEWHRVAVFGGTASFVKNYVTKGAKVYVEGSLRTRKWTDNSGVEKYTTEVVVSGFSDRVELLSKKEDSGAQSGTISRQPEYGGTRIGGALDSQLDDDIAF